MSIPSLSHAPVLLDEVAALLDPAPGACIVDGTAGLGGHAAALAARAGAGARVVLIDLDAGNLARAKERVKATGAAVFAVHGNFAESPEHLARLGLRADVLLADLGFASTQVDDPARGLSFRADGPLDMRLDPSSPGMTAADLVASLPEGELARIIFEYGEDRYARRIARNVVAARDRSPITTTAALAAIVRSGVPAPRRGHGRPGIDAATRTFQALRIAVNDEIGSLERLLKQVGLEAQRLAGGTEAGGLEAGVLGEGRRNAGWLNPGARVGIIAFHSLEDRPVKQAFRALVDGGLATGLTRKPVTASEAEMAGNPRSRSAKLRVIEVGGAKNRTDGHNQA